MFTLVAKKSNMQTPRQRQILELLHSKGDCAVDHLAETLRVSDMTIRRDLQTLAEEGLVLRTHGGASPVESVRFEFKFLERAQVRRNQKEAIGRAAAALVKAGQSVLLDSGTTTLAVARELRALAPLTVITTSLPIASVMQRSGNAEIVLLGGTLRRESPDLEGPLTESNLQTLRADVALFGADGIDLEGTAYNASLSVARLLSSGARSAARVYIVADSSKIGTAALSSFGNLSTWAGLITDSEIAPSHVSALRARGVNVIIAEPSGSGGKLPR